MADDIEDDGPGPSASSYFSKAATALHGTNTSKATASSNPQLQPSMDRQKGTVSTKPGVVQPKPQALPKRSGPSSIIVSPRQKGNPVLEKIRSMPWEWGEIPADYLLGATTCALFLSLKYHRLHPEYIYTRINNLQGKYLLRIVLCMVDIQNHEESLKELSKTSVINNVTIVLCWSAAEGARYLELFKTYEHAAPTSIKQHQSTTYSDRMVDFVTTPRAINKTDAVSLVSQFGTIRTAVNSRHEEVSSIAGWGEKKVQQWLKSVQEPFRVQQAAKRGIDLDALLGSQPTSRAPTLSRDITRVEDSSPPQTSAPAPSGPPKTNGDSEDQSRAAEHHVQAAGNFADDEEAFAEVEAAPYLSKKPTAKRNIAPSSVASTEMPQQKRKQNDDPLSDGVMAALNKLRKT